MSKVHAKLRELRNADVRYISLVDRAATRIPFRILKRQENGMDLAKIFKGESVKKGEVKVISVIVKSQKDPAVAEEIRQLIAKNGFTTDRVIKSDLTKTVSYDQADKVKDEETGVVRLSEEMVLIVKGFNSFFGGCGGADEDTSFADLASASGFYAGINGALDILYREVCDEMYESSDPKAASAGVKSLLGEFSDYIMTLVGALPAAAFKADIAVREILRKKSEEEKGKAMDKQVTVKMDLFKIPTSAPSGIAQNDWDVLNDDGKINWILGSWASKNVSSAGPGNNEDTKKAEEVKKAEELKKAEEIKKAEELKAEEAKKAEAVAAEAKKTAAVIEKCDKCSGDHKTSEHDEKMAAKKDVVTLDAIRDVFNIGIKDLTEKVDGVVKEQKSQREVLDGVVKKTETLEGKITTTVTAVANPADRPATGLGLVKKEDDDPRTGCFDTAFLPGRSRVVKRA